MSASVAHDLSDREMIEFSEDEHLTFFFNIDQVYSEIPGVIQNYGTFAQSIQISRQLSNTIIKNAIIEAQERFIQRNIPINAINEIESETKLLLNAQLNDGGIEVETCYLNEDQEPEPIFCDRWRRNRISIINELDNHDKDQNDEKYTSDPNKILDNQKQTLQKHFTTDYSTNNTKRTTLRLPTTPQQNQFEAKLISIYSEEFEDEFEDKLRNAKLYEMKKKNEIEQKKKEDKLQSQIEKKDGGSQKYTYDFDGKILLARAVKMDKLQPTNQKLKVEFKEPQKIEQQIQPQKKGGKRDSTKINKPQCPEQEIPNRVLQERKDTTKEVIGDKALRIDKTSQFPYEVFTMNNGVKLFFEHKMKEGIRHQISDSAEHLQIKLSGSNLLSGDDAQKFASQIRLTKAEYQLLTDAQTLQATKSQFMPSENINNPDHDQQVNQQSILLKKKLGEIGKAEIQQDSKQVQFNTGSNLLQPIKKDLPPQQTFQTERIQLKNVKMIENLIVTALPDTPKSSKQEIPLTQLPDGVSKNPIDIFNQQLLNQKEWGKQIGIKTNYFPPVKQQKRSLETKAYKGSLEQMYKMPRERLVAQTGRTAMNFYKSNEDGSKKITKSLTDGLMQTFYTTHSKFSDKLRQ
ncbi:unnamed protein product [Paramecium sonneborni]|uniref:Uncharacterized protein n=1 Tax=Paramecium sonneborni TaxID=65129 RepID=A0A8S1LAZ2_9CILI|nr:unnamed protein product [Paramecium sonneborni]